MSIIMPRRSKIVLKSIDRYASSRVITPHNTINTAPSNAPEGLSNLCHFIFWAEMITYVNAKMSNDLISNLRDT